MKKNPLLEKLLNEIASEAIIGRLMENPERIEREDVSRLLPEHAALIIRRYPELREKLSVRRADRSAP